MAPRAQPHDHPGCGWYDMLAPPAPARRLSSHERADCVVVGAGFTGLATARQLSSRRPDWRVVVLDAQRVGFGASGRNSGFVVDVGHYEPARGVEGNGRLARLGRAGRDHLRELVRRHGIDCAWTERGRLHGAVGRVGMQALERFRAGLDAMAERYAVLDADAVARITGTTHYRAALHTPGTVMVQPAALVRGLAATLPAGVELLEESPVRAIHSGARVEVEAGAGTVTADRLFLAANGFTPALGFLQRRVFPLATFASLTRVLTDAEREALGGDPEWGLVPEEPMGTTVRRTRDHRVLVRNTVRYTTTVDAGHLRDAGGEHRRALRVRFPALADVPFEYGWGGVMGMSLNGAYHFGRLGPAVFAAAGCNGVGVALGTIAGRLLADLALGAESPLLSDMQALPGPTWIPPEPFLGIGVRVTLARMAARAREEL